ncbi:hypothetical protein PIB30_034230 [Stylosanthes scabra]|uniref:Uncharacterized protein n=1 Tax=Stylosanthes scabra TaxID=79078 RepID=A0ABU6UG23_9FABA|nr:hypothetical protein [Stylosanthes scabra]
MSYISTWSEMNGWRYGYSYQVNKWRVSEVRLQRDGGRFGSPSCFPPGYDQRDDPLVSYRTRSGWPYNRSNELIGRRAGMHHMHLCDIAWVCLLAYIACFSGTGSSLESRRSVPPDSSSLVSPQVQVFRCGCMEN